MNTAKLLKSLENEQFLSREQAFEVYKTAIAEFSRRSKAAKALENSIWDMVLACGCPNAVYSKAEALVSRYSH